MTDVQKQLNNREVNDDFGLITRAVATDKIEIRNYEPPAAASPRPEQGSFLANLMAGIKNPWARLLIYCLTCLTTSCLYFGWQDYSKMLIKSGAFDWKCDASNIGDVDDPDDPSLCVDQSKAVAGLYAFANGSEFVCAAVAGLMLDTIGPRYTAIVGELLQFLAIIGLSFSSRSFQVYIPALILSGASTNVISFPALTVMEMWPTRQAFAVSVVVGAQSAASVIALILERIWEQHPTWTYRGIWLSYLAIIWLPFTLLYIYCLPQRRDYSSLIAVKKDEELPMEPADDELHLSTEHQQLTNPKSWKQFFKELLTIDMMAMAIFFGMLMFQFAYYPAIVRDAVSGSVSDLVGIITPLQGPFSVIIGFLMDYTGTTLIMLIMCATLILVNLSCGLIPDNDAYMKFIGFVFIFVQSATYNVKYTFVGEMYDPFNFGKLVGFLGICGGIGVYISSPVTQPTDYKKIFFVLTALISVMIAATFFILYRQKIKRVTHKTLQPVQQAHRGEANEINV